MVLVCFDGMVTDWNSSGRGQGWKTSRTVLGQLCQSECGTMAKQQGYLSTLIPDLTWFQKDKDAIKKDVDLDELAEIKQKEAEAMAEALGGGSVTASKDEIKKLIQQDIRQAQESIIGLGSK